MREREIERERERVAVALKEELELHTAGSMRSACDPEHVTTLH